MTVAVFGDFPSADTAGYLVDKGTHYSLSTDGDEISFKGSALAHTFANNDHIAVTAKYGKKPEIYVDGSYIGIGASNWTYSQNTDDPTIGNSVAGSAPTPYAVRQVLICDTVLTHYEIKALYEQAQVIGALPMPAGSLLESTPVVKAGTTPISESLADPGVAYFLVDVYVNFDTKPTTSENIAIYSTDGTTIKLEALFDPSTATLASNTFRFDKYMVNGRTLRIDYTNTDMRNVTIGFTYLKDNLVQ
jgi:hypothetical protein